MKIYKIKVNGKTYRVELEAIEEVASSSSPAPAAKEEVKDAAPSPKNVELANGGSSEGREVNSPIQGTVVRVLAKVGDAVKKGTPLVVVEAMKLENEVVSPYDGTVSAIKVEKGQAVASKEVIALIK